MRAARVWCLSNQALLLPENAGDCCQDGHCTQLLLSLMCWSLERCPSEIIFAALDSAVCTRADPSGATSLLQNAPCRTHLNPLYPFHPSYFGMAPNRWRWFLPTGQPVGQPVKTNKNFKAVMPHSASSGLSWLLSFCSANWITNMTSLEKSDFSVIMNSSFKSSF